MFDLEKLEKNRNKSINVIQASSFYKFIHEDIIDRLEPLDKTFDEHTNVVKKTQLIIKVHHFMV